MKAAAGASRMSIGRQLKEETVEVSSPRVEMAYYDNNSFLNVIDPYYRALR